MRTGASAGAGSAGSPRYPENRGARSRRRSPPPRPGPRLGDRDAHAGERRRPAEPGWSQASSRGERRGPGARLGQAVGGHDRPAGPERAGDERGRDGAAAQQDGAQRRRRRGVAGGIQDPGELRRHERRRGSTAGLTPVRAPPGARPGRPAGSIRTGHPPADRPPHDPEARHVTEAQGHGPAGRGRQRGQPCIGARGHGAGREHDPLRPAGGAGGQDDDGRRLGVAVRCRETARPWR